MKVKLLEYFIRKNNIVAILFDPMEENVGMMHTHEIQMGSKKLADGIKSFLKNVNLTTGTSPDDPFTANEWNYFCGAWGRILLEPIDDMNILKETDILYISPHQILHYLPFHAVRFEGKYLCESMAICYIPSPAILRRCQLQNKARRLGKFYRPEKCLSVGYDLLSQDSNTQEAFCQFAREVAGYFLPKNRTVLTGLCSRSAEEMVATVDNLKSICKKQKFDLLSFFCHGYFNQDDPMASKIYLPPNGMTVSDIMSEFYTDADLVTLIACTSAEPDVRRGDEVYSLSMAMIFSGAAAVTGALWRAHTPAARFFFKRFISSWCSGVPKALAFQKAQKEMILSKKFSHPYHWAPYIFIGDWI